MKSRKRKKKLSKKYYLHKKHSSITLFNFHCKKMLIQSKKDISKLGKNLKMIKRKKWIKKSMILFFSVSFIHSSLFVLSWKFFKSTEINIPKNLCEIFKEKPDWLRTLTKAQKKWQISIPTTMAIMSFESSFNARAQPPRKFWIGPRLSSAKGYSQALDGTWLRYMKETKRWQANRSTFSDSIDFMGWYQFESQKIQIKANDSINQYLAYYYGHFGFSSRTISKQSRIYRLAVKVNQKATKYESQLKKCKSY